MSGNIANTSDNVSNSLLGCLKKGCVINPYDNNRLFIPHRKLKEICNYQAVVEALTLEFPEKDASFHKELASAICHGRDCIPPSDITKASHTAIDALNESGKPTIPNGSTLTQQATTKDGTVVSPKTSQSCYRIFAILVLIGHVRLIETFLDHPLSDKDLPLSSTPHFEALWSPKINPVSHVQAPREYENGNWIEMFIYQQWSVLAPYFEPNTTGDPQCKVYEFHQNQILPIEEVSKKQYRGGFGFVKKIKIHSEHHDFNHEYFALKTMIKETPDCRDEAFQQELFALLTIKPDCHIIEFCAAFKKGDSRGFLFPWANGGSLDELWTKSPSDIVESAEVQWSQFVRWICIQCHGIIKGLMAIHELPGDNEMLFGIHNDIKPDNILYFAQDVAQEGLPLGSLKISDLGLMNFHKQDSRTKKSPSMGRAYQPYRSPEHEKCKIRSRKIDIWAFGCLFAELITWVIRGANGIAAFKEKRINDSDKEFVEDSFFTLKSCFLAPKKPKLKSSIKAWFAELINGLGQGMNETFIPEFLQFILNRMLHPDRKERAECKEVEAFLKKLREKPADSPYWRFGETVPYPLVDERDGFFQQELDAFHKGTHIIEISVALMKG
ncbi:hypothetical protein CFAM422_010371 [Trichoderma lentiforme]|uniref:Protein kinase domain-containing protein n=1 Tax=Trichoderma lentiforme TaxID=1567552 RepID=A0A9P4X8J2_9HYPO|nr:hypothetical protein CFAM422_010371 [Trichoderma lentiforme]